VYLHTYAAHPMVSKLSQAGPQAGPHTVTIARDIDDIKAIGVGALSLLNGAILVAIVAVILAGPSQTASVIKTFLQFLAYLVASVVAPVTGGRNVALSATPAPAGPVPAATGPRAPGTGGTQGGIFPQLPGGGTGLPASNIPPDLQGPLPVDPNASTG
jgi:hypothetical protein